MRNVVYTVVFIAFLAIPALANQGVLMVVKGDISVQSKSGTSQKAKVGMKVQEGDTIVAGKDSRAKIVMVDKNIFNISPDSKIVIEKYVSGEEQKNVSLNVLYGKVRSTVKQKYDGEKNTFNVKTPSAVAGVRGTDFVTQFNQVTLSTKIVTFEGRVMTGTGFSPTGQIMNAVAVNPGQFTVASPGAPPAPPAEVPKQELASMQRDTSADAASGTGSNSERNPSSEGKKEGGDKGDGGGGEPKGGDSGASDSGKDKKDGGDRQPSSSLGVDKSDMTADKGTKEPVAGPVFNCPTCGNLNAFPPPLPPELLNTGKTKLNITIGQ